MAEHTRSPDAWKRALVAYFSWSGNTREVAIQIHKIVGGRLFEIVSADKYPRDYDECVKQAKRELDSGYLPSMGSDVGDLGSYDFIFIGYPNWWGTIPRPVASFLSRCNSSSKTIVPFCTHGGGRLGRSVEDIAKVCPNARVLEAIAISDGEVARAQDKISEWLHRLDLDQ